MQFCIKFNKTKTMMRAFLFFMIFFMYSAVLCAQNIRQNIRGQVVDIISRQPLIGANLMILGTDLPKGTVTDLEGRFLLKNVPVGRYTLRFTFIGYETFIVKDVLVSGAIESNIFVELKEQSSELGEVKITATNSRQRALNPMASVSVNHLNAEDTRRFAGGLDDPARLVQAYAGVSGDMSGNGIIVRGNAPKGLLWRMEGIYISNPNHFANITSFGGGAFTALSSQLLGGTDFFTSAFPSEYGNALSGVFDLRMRNGSTQKREYGLSIGTLGLEASAEGPFKNGGGSSFIFNYRYSTFALLEPVLPENASLLRYQDLSFKLNFPLGKAGTLSLWGLGAIDYTGQNVKADTTDWIYEGDKEDVDGNLSFGAAGLAHQISLGKKSWLKTTAAVSGNSLEWLKKRSSSDLELNPMEDVEDKSWRMVFNTRLSHKFCANHNNVSGFTYSRMFYNIHISKSYSISLPLVDVVGQKENTGLSQFFSQSSVALGAGWSINPGFHALYFELNNQVLVEPRLSLQWQFQPKHRLALAYGAHSQVEMLALYYARSPQGDSYAEPNRDLKLTRANHFVLSWEFFPNENHHLKTEVYFQNLYDVPVIQDSSFSVLNLDQNWFINSPLVNNGTGYNYGIELTFERSVYHGFYYLITMSLFESKYRGGDNIERNARWNKQLVLNALVGKEWLVGKNKNNLLGLSGRFNYSGGEYISPVDLAASEMAGEVVYDEYKAFSERKPNSLHFDLSLNLRRNHERYTGIWSLQLINIFGAPEYQGYKYNLHTQEIEEDKQTIVLPSVSYKIVF